MFINDFDIKIHLYGDEKNFGLITIDDGRLNGDKEHDKKICNILPQASFPIKKITPEKIGEVVKSYISSCLTEMQDSDYDDALIMLELHSIKEIEHALNLFIHSLFFNNEVLKEYKEKYVEVSFIKIFSFESFFLKFNDSFKNEELQKVLQLFCYLIYGKNNSDLTYEAKKSIVNISKMTSLGLECKNYVDHIDVVNALKNQGNIKGVDFSNSPYDIDFDNFVEFILDYGGGKKRFDDSNQYSSRLFFTNTEFMGMILSRIAYFATKNEKELCQEFRPMIYSDQPCNYYFMDAKKKAGKDDYKFCYGVMKN